jgi:protocatechuate 3,4-dioxygenase beta subunit
MKDHHRESEHDDYGGLARDLQKFVATSNRRQVLRLFAGASLIPWLGCGTDGMSGVDDAGSPDGGGTSPDGSGTANPGTCATIPEETDGPYPGDGSNGANALALGGIVRSDIRSSLGALSGTAGGVPLTMKLTLVNTGAACAPLAGYAVYLWHCDREGFYSMYTLTSQNYLRGVQETDASGTVTFTSIFPACYPGRWPHVHFEIFPSVAKALAVNGKVKTSQLALPADVCNTVYATSGYEQSVTSLSRISLASDNVFSDGASLQVATMSGSVSAGYTAALTVGVAV